MDSNVKEMMEQLKKDIQNADKVLVGIGEEFTDKQFEQSELYIRYQKQEREELSWMLPFLQAAYYQESKDNKYRQAYEKLSGLLAGKDYFVLTLQADPYLEDSGLDKERIVAPCGSFQRVQCIEDCTHQAEPAGSLPCDIAAQFLSGLGEVNRPACPHCGRELVLNIYPQEHYCEQGYAAQWQKYQKWVAETMNRKVILLELGAGFTLPNIIRWPFEKMVFYNQKAYLYRIHEKFPQISEELHEKAVSVSLHAVDFLLNVD